MEKGSIRFSCSDPRLEEGFRWASSQALAYSHEGDPVGRWYDAALPGREAFCMRDVSHQAAGAHFLGLAEHNKNMLFRFAGAVEESRDYCSYWEITRSGGPAPVDYANDRDFWYNLPANFDVLDACWRMYCLTGDRDYLYDPVFTRFYDLTVGEYISRWDHDGDGIPDRAVPGSRRGIPSYDEQKGMEQVLTASDLIAAQYRGLLSYARLREPAGKDASGCVNAARRLGEHLRSQWWDGEHQRFYGAKALDGTMLSSLGSPHLLAYFGAVEDGAQRAAVLEQIRRLGDEGVGAELLSYYPEIFFRMGTPEQGLEWLYRLIDPGLIRREYPEVSFAAVGAYVGGLMGVCADAAGRTLYTAPRLPISVDCAEILNCPLFDGSISLRIEPHSTAVYNGTGAPLRWRGGTIAASETRTVTI